MIDRATIEEILNAVHIEEVIGDFVSLKKRGASYWGLCPFHEDRNPSMSVSPSRGIFKCFSCGKAGNAIHFVIEHEHLSYPEAIKYLGKKYGIEVVDKEDNPEEAASRLRYESLLLASEYAAKHFQNILWNTEEGRAVGLSYFKERNFTDETIRKFGLGFAAGKNNSLVKAALKDGYKEEYLVDSNVCVRRDNGELSDRYFERVMFPIHSISGRVIAFGGRTLKNDKNIAKYVNSAETEIYHKSSTLYGLFFAKSSISKSDKCILVEGYADVISMHQLGIENVVASSGTSLTVGQIHLIKRFTNNVTVLYDGDEPGIKASLRGADLLLEEGMNVKVVLLPPEDDPDSFANSHTKDEFLDYIAQNECDFVTHKSKVFLKNAESDPYKKTQLINDIIRTVSVIPDQVLRKIYVEQIADTFHQSQDDILHKILEFREKKRQLDSSRRKVQENPTTEYPQSDVAPYEGPVSAQVPIDRYAITDTFLSFSEKEIIYYLMKFGCYPLYFEKDMQYGATAVPGSVCVWQFIKEAMDEDELELHNLLYKDIYDEFFRIVNNLSGNDYKEKQSNIVRHFTTIENQTIAKSVIEMLCESHQLTIKSYQQSIAPEEYMLATKVPRVILLYKSRVMEQACKQLHQKLASAQKEGDAVLQKELLSQLQVLLQIKNGFDKELKKV